MEYTIKSLLDTEIGEVIDANARGDYRARVSVEDKSGALLLLAQTINRLGQATTEGLEQIRGTLSASLAGEDGHSIEGDYHGLIGEIQTDVNRMTRQLGIAVTGMASSVDAAANGDFSSQLDVDALDGTLHDLCAGINRINGICNAGLDDLQVALDALAAGDLGATMAREHAGQFGQLQQVLANSVGNLNGMLSDIAMAARRTADAGTETAQTSEKLDRLSDQTSQEMKEAENILSSLSIAANENAGLAAKSRELSGVVLTKAESGLNMSQQAADGMQRMQSATDEIGRAIEEINSVARQTKLLSLNASVEAMRSGGSTGAGFRVVAEEIRNLAGKVEEVAQQISERVETVLAEVVDASGKVRATHQALSDIASSATATRL